MKTRKKYIGLTMFDFLKGLGILLVLVRHSTEGMHYWLEQEIWTVLYSVLMPMFFVTSGYWLKKRRFWEGTKLSARLFLKPYLIVIGCINGVGLVHRGLQHNLDEWVSLFLRPSLLVMSGNNTRIGFLWFIFALMMGWILFYGLIQIPSQKLKILASLLVAWAGTMLLPYRLPFQLAQGMIAQIFVLMGFLLKKNKVLERQIPPFILIGLTIVWLAGVRFCFPEQMGDLAMYEYGNGMPAVLCSMCGAWLSIWVGIRINAAENVVVEKIGQIGRYTMWILCAHSFEATVVPWNVLTVIAPEQTWTYCILKLVLRSIFVFMVCILLSKLGGNKHAGKNH